MEKYFNSGNNRICNSSGKSFITSKKYIRKQCEFNYGRKTTISLQYIIKLEIKRKRYGRVLVSSRTAKRAAYGEGFWIEEERIMVKQNKWRAKYKLV